MKRFARQDEDETVVAIVEVVRVAIVAVEPEITVVIPFNLEKRQVAILVSNV